MGSKSGVGVFTIWGLRRRRNDEKSPGHQRNILFFFVIFVQRFFLESGRSQFGAAAIIVGHY